MIITQQEYIDRIAKRTAENKEYLDLSLRQRRNQVVDLQGIEFTRAGDPDSAANFYVTISPDMIYMERFEFKLIIEESTATSFRVSVDGVDISSYLMAQYGGNWIRGNGIYPSTNVNKNYDILKVASDLYLQGEYEGGNALVRPGYKRVSITGNGNFYVTMTQFLKYSHMNR